MRRDSGRFSCNFPAMTEPKPAVEPPAELDKGKAVATGGAAAVAASGPVAANQLTPEEQMALFEKELKENDWGHQPC